MRRHAQSQKRLMDLSATAMRVKYFREEGVLQGWRFYTELRRFTIDCNFDFKRWKKHQTATRNLRLWKPGRLVRWDSFSRLIFPDMFVLGVWAGFVSRYNQFVLASYPEEVVTTVKHGITITQHPAMLTLPMECLSVTSIALGLLLTFHCRSCYDRWDDARAQWGLIINESRAYASRMLNRLPSFKGGDELRVLRERRHAVKLVQSFPHTLKYHLTEDGCNPHIAINAETTEVEIKHTTSLALRAELQLIWDCEDEREAEILNQILAPDAGSRPLFVLHALGQINSDIFADPMSGGLDPIYSSEMDRSLTLFQHVLGRCERILRTPVYTPYTKFTSRFLYLWCGALPLAFCPLLGPITSVPVSVAMSFFLFGIQDVGARVEQPFNAMPLWQYCQTVDQSCEQLLRHTKALESLEEAEGDGESDDGLGEFDDAGPLLSYVDPL